jgi:hypothetical protein
MYRPLLTQSTKERNGFSPSKDLTPLGDPIYLPTFFMHFPNNRVRFQTARIGIDTKDGSGIAEILDRSQGG